jgi:hypothetical protein
MRCIRAAGSISELSRLFRLVAESPIVTGLRDAQAVEKAPHANPGTTTLRSPTGSGLVRCVEPTTFEIGTLAKIYEPKVGESSPRDTGRG